MSNKNIKSYNRLIELNNYLYCEVKIIIRLITNLKSDETI